MNVTPREFLSLRAISTERIRLFRIGESLHEQLRSYFGTGPFPAIADSIDMNKKSSHTESFNRILLNWLALQNAMSRVRQAHPVHEESPLTPWDCHDNEVRRLWNDITQPNNLDTFWEWLCHSAAGEQEVWALQALQECQQRSENEISR
jgi:hypothetical protein